MPSPVIVTCPSCGVENRIPADKEGKQGRCGSCRAVLPQMYRTPQQLSSGTFDAFLANYPGPVLVEFWGPTCPHCLSFAPAVRTAAERLAGRAAVVQINTQENPALAARFAVRGIPLVMLFRNGRVVDQLPGARSADELLAWLRRHV
jgi:thioredoxin 2